MILNNVAKYYGATNTAALTVLNAQAADALVTYTCVTITNLATNFWSTTKYPFTNFNVL